MALGARMMSVWLVLGIEMALGAHAVARAAISDLVDVQAVLLAGPETLHEYDDSHLVAYLLESGFAERLVTLGCLQLGRRTQRLLGRRLAGGKQDGGSGGGQHRFHLESPFGTQSTHFFVRLEVPRRAVG